MPTANNFNDIFESSFSVESEGHNLNEFIGKLPENAKLRHRHITKKQAKSLVQWRRWQDYSTKFATLCMSQIWHSPAMWGHYSENGGGAIIGINTDNPVFEHGDGPFPVSYSRRRPLFTVLDGEYSLPTPLLVKSTEWKYEREWRYMEHMDQSEPSKYGTGMYKRFPRDSIPEIILGPRITFSDAHHIYRFIADFNLNTKLFITQPSLSLYKLNRYPITSLSDFVYLVFRDIDFTQPFNN